MYSIINPVIIGDITIFMNMAQLIDREAFEILSALKARPYYG